MQHLEDITIRLATPADGGSLRRLAALDSSRALTGDVLVAEAGGTILAAIAVSNGEVVADPFERTAELVELLRLRAGRRGPQRARAPGRRRALQTQTA